MLTKLGVKKSEKKQISAPEATAVMAGTAFGLKGIERGLAELKNRKNDFKSFDEVKHYYKDMKPGDVMFFQETFQGGKGHPIVVLDNKNSYYWPSEKGWGSGTKTPLKVPRGARHTTSRKAAKTDWKEGRKHVQQILKNKNKVDHYDYTPHKGRFFEVLNRGGAPVEVGSLEGKMFEMASIQKKVRQPDGSFVWKREFNPQAARRLSSVWRAPDLDPKKMEKAVKDMQSRSEQGKIRYSAFSKGMDTAGRNCAKGHCIHGADELLRRSGVARPKSRAYFPGQFAEGLNKIKDAKTKGTSGINMFAPMVATGGALAVAQGLQEDDSRKTLVGAGAVGTGVLLNSVKGIKDGLNSAGGIVARSTGGMILEAPSKIIDKFVQKKHKGIYVPQWRTQRYAFEQWSGRNPKAAGRVGALALGVPAAYGVHKAIQTLSEPGKKKK